MAQLKSGSTVNGELIVIATDSRLSDSRTPTSHAIAGNEHSASTLVNLNSKISDATLIDTNDSRLSDSRDPNTHGDTAHSETYIKEGDARLTDARTPTSHAIAGNEHSASTLAQLNAKISDATLIDTNDSRLSDSRDPNSHNNTAHSETYATEDYVTGAVGAVSFELSASYNNHTLISETNTVAIGIDGFNSTTHVLFTYQNSVFIAVGEDYTISGTDIVKTSGTWDSGTKFNFMTLKVE